MVRKCDCFVNFTVMKANSYFGLILLLLLMAGTISAQDAVLIHPRNISLKGRVIDVSTGEPVPFANVVLNAGKTVLSGSQTDFNGNYYIEWSGYVRNDDSLVILASFVGYHNFTLRLNGYRSTGLNIRLDSTQDSPIFVGAGCSFVHRQLFLENSNTTTISRDELMRMPR